MREIKRFKHGGGTTGASVLDRPPFQGCVSTGRMYPVRVWNIQLASATAGSSDTRWRASRSTGSTSSLRKAEPVMPVEGLEDRFLRLSNEWKRDTGHLSLVSQIAAHPSYKGIVAMGEPVIPLILRDLQTEPDHWFSALSAIASEDPEIPVHERGDIRAVSEAWVKWGKTKKYID